METIKKAIISILKPNLNKNYDYFQCNGCGKLWFGKRRCVELNKQLNTVTSTDGYISVVTPLECPRLKGEN